MASIDGNIALVTLLAALAGGLDKPTSNWSEIEVRLPASAQAVQMLDQQANIVDGTRSTQIRLSPPDFFRIVELAPMAIKEPDVLREAPAEPGTLLHIRTGEGQDYYFVAEQEQFKDRNSQEIWNILAHYRN